MGFKVNKKNTSHQKSDPLLHRFCAVELGSCVSHPLVLQACKHQEKPKEEERERPGQTISIPLKQGLPPPLPPATPTHTHTPVSAAVNQIQKGATNPYPFPLCCCSFDPSLQIKDKRSRVLDAVVALKQSASKSSAMDAS